MSFDKVAMDIVPHADEIAVGTKVIFPQGTYVGGENNSGGIRYHEGVVKKIYQDERGRYFYDGEHLLKPADGKMEFYAYQDEFTGLVLEDLRMSPNAIDAVMAFNK